MALKDKIKEAICSRRLDSGDIVKVTEGGTWAETAHPLGGKGRWAVFIEKKGNKAVVRPWSNDGTTEAKTLVDRVEHIDDIIRDEAIKEYKKNRSSNR